MIHYSWTLSMFFLTKRTVFLFSYDLSFFLFHSNLKEIKGKAEHTLNTANEWQREQHRRDELINKKIAMQEEHIRCTSRSSDAILVAIFTIFMLYLVLQ